MIDTLEIAQTSAAETDSPALFEPEDSRAGPFTSAEIEEARRYAKEPGRWHKLNPILDWHAVRLQYGRGLPMPEIATLFEIEERSIYRRRSAHKWSSRMSERDRRWLAQLVWLAGEARLAPNDAEGRRKLATRSEWRPFTPPEPIKWRPQDPEGEGLFKLGYHAGS